MTLDRNRAQRTNDAVCHAAGGDWLTVLWCAQEHEVLTERAWDLTRAEAAVAAIVADAEAAAGDVGWPNHPLDDEPATPYLTSLYLGSAGMIWGLHELGSSIDAAGLVTRGIEQYRISPDFGTDAHPPSLLVGETGLLAVAARVGAASADDQRLGELVHANREHGTWELLYGSPGTMLAAQARNLEAEWQASARLLWEQWDASTDLWTQTLGGQAAQYLGPAHGFAGNVYALRGYVSDEVLRSRATRVLERTALRHDGLINWPPVAQPRRGHDTVRVQWCHGAPGIISTLADLMPLDLALAAGDLVWAAGPLRKGPGLCHGTAGNGFALLKLFTLTGDQLWLERARRFAMHAIEQVQRGRWRYGRGRYTLWTGDVGVALYLRACSRAHAVFPTIDKL